MMKSHIKATGSFPNVPPLALATFVYVMFALCQSPVK